jgi:DNA-binding protein Fis
MVRILLTDNMTVAERACSIRCNLLRGNKTKTADLLGINWDNLRKKLKN